MILKSITLSSVRTPYFISFVGLTLILAGLICSDAKAAENDDQTDRHFKRIVPFL